MSQGERTQAVLEGTVTSDHLQSEYKVWTWGKVAQELINYRRKYGPVVSSSSEFEPRGVRLAAVSPAPRPPSPKLSGTGRVSLPVKTGRQNIDHKRNCLWILSWQKGVPRNLMNGLPTGRLEKLVNWWPEQKPITPMSHDAVADKPGKHSFLPGQPVLIDSANLRTVS